MSAVADILRVLARVLDGQGLPWFGFGAQAVAVRRTTGPSLTALR